MGRGRTDRTDGRTDGRLDQTTSFLKLTTFLFLYCLHSFSLAGTPVCLDGPGSSVCLCLGYGRTLTSHYVIGLRRDCPGIVRALSGHCRGEYYSRVVRGIVWVLFVYCPGALPRYCPSDYPGIDRGIIRGIVRVIVQGII